MKTNPQRNCGGICQRYRATMPPNNQSRYQLGQKRCTMCGVFQDYEGMWCPCCGHRLRTHRRSGKYKTKIVTIYN